MENKDFVNLKRGTYTRDKINGIGIVYGIYILFDKGGYVEALYKSNRLIRINIDYLDCIKENVIDVLKVGDLVNNEEVIGFDSIIDDTTKEETRLSVITKLGRRYINEDIKKVATREDLNSITMDVIKKDVKI